MCPINEKIRNCLPARDSISIYCVCVLWIWWMNCVLIEKIIDIVVVSNGLWAMVEAFTHPVRVVSASGAHTGRAPASRRLKCSTNWENSKTSQFHFMVCCGALTICTHLIMAAAAGGWFALRQWHLYYLLFEKKSYAINGLLLYLQIAPNSSSTLHPDKWQNLQQ